jgi:hypothetical protein
MIPNLVCEYLLAKNQDTMGEMGDINADQVMTDQDIEILTTEIMIEEKGVVLTQEKEEVEIIK